MLICRMRYRWVKTGTELTLTNSIHRCICKESRNIGRENDEKAAERAAKARPAIENEKQHPLIFWKLDSHVQDVLIFLTFLRRTKHVLQSFSITVNKLEGWKGGNFHGRFRATLSLATSLSTAVHRLWSRANESLFSPHALNVVSAQQEWVEW